MEKGHETAVDNSLNFQPESDRPANDEPENDPSVSIERHNNESENEPSENNKSENDELENRVAEISDTEVDKTTPAKEEQLTITAVPEHPGSKLRILSVEKDTREVHSVKNRRKPSLLCYSSLDMHPLFGDPVLFVEPDAVKAILNFTDWGEHTQKNDVEQAALIYGRLCEYKRHLGTSVRWGEVCGIIPAEAELATPLSIKISADEWKRMNIALDDLNRAAEEKGGETYVSLGWMHTHPHQLDPFFSSVDVELQRTIMDNDDLFGLVINPHRQIFSCFKDAGSKPCKAVFELSEELSGKWSFRKKTKAEVEQPWADTASGTEKDKSDVLIMKSKREAASYGNQKSGLIPVTFCEISQHGAAIQTSRFPVKVNHAIPSDSFSFIVHILKQSNRPFETVAVVMLLEHLNMRLVSLIPKEFFPTLRSSMDREWYDYCYAAMLTNDGDFDAIKRMNYLVREWSTSGYVSHTRFTPVILLNEKTNHAYIMSKKHYLGGN